MRSKAAAIVAVHAFAQQCVKARHRFRRFKTDAILLPLRVVS